jgi:endonuclease G
MKRKKKKQQKWVAQLLVAALVLGSVWYNNACQKSTFPTSQLELPQLQTSVASQQIVHEGYVVSYNQDWRLPNWVAYELTAQETQGDVARNDHFYPDPMVLGVQATKDDYRNSGYDRGHMAPAADMKWSETAMRESFYFTNICPQIHNLNAGVWQDFEDRVRKWANQYGKVYVACGPIVQNNKLGTIGANKVVVPDGFYKVCLVENNGRYEAMGLLFDHVSGRKKLKNYVCTVDSVEKLTGIDFFCRLPNDTEDRVESQVHYPVWGFK